MAGPVERKVQASTAAAAAAGLALWALGHYVFRSGVPDVVASWIYVLVPGALTFGAGYLAKHTDRLIATVTVPGRRVTAADFPGLPPGPAPGATPPPQKTLLPPAAPE
jgi:hypothetical protein